MQQTIIYRHWFGAAIIGLAGGIVIAGLVVLSWFGFKADDPAQWLIMFAALVTGLVTLVALAVYYLNHIELSDTGILYVKYSALFSRLPVEADWNTVQRIEAQQQGIFSAILGYGVLTVITAGSTQNLTMTYVPDAEAWQKYIDANATYGVGDGR